MSAAEKAKLPMEGEQKAFGHLMAELDFDFCLKCGACVASCPLNSLQLDDEGPAIRGECTNCGLCYYQCPQFINTQELASRIFDEVPKSEELGVYTGAYSTRASGSKIRRKGQDGGTVTALLASLLEDGFIDGAILTVEGSDPWRPEPKVAISKDEIVEGSGTIYVRGQKILGVQEAADLYKLKKIAVVGLPCQLKSIRRMEFGGRDLRTLRSRIKLLIGLFCSESFSYLSLEKIVEEKLGVNLGDAQNIDIKKGSFIVYPKEGSKQEIPVKTLKKYATASCMVCEDYSAELADISVGSVGASPGHSAVLVRTPVGEEAFKIALKADAVESKPLEDVEPGIELLKKLALRNKEKARENIDESKKEESSLPPRLEQKQE